MLLNSRRKRNRSVISRNNALSFSIIATFAAIVSIKWQLEFSHSNLSLRDIVDSNFFAPSTNSKLNITRPRKMDASRGLPKTLVIYFPQYHRDSVNDRNWGVNFTDWDSLRLSPVKNKIGQVIPRPLNETPTNSSDNDNLQPPLGYYDLADQKPRKIQGALAKTYGVDGFIYHHYWFYDPSDPGPTLAKPLENMLEDGHPDIPFFLNWCPVKWVNVWMGKAIFQKIRTSKNHAITLQEQYFNATDDMIYQHYRWLKPFFHHPNYIRVDGQPAFLVYYWDPLSLPILETLRKFAVEDGFPGLHFIIGRSSHHEDLYDISHLVNNKDYNYVLNRRQTRNSVDPTHTAVNSHSIYSLNHHNPSSDKRTMAKTWKYNPFNQTMTYPYPLNYIHKPYEVPHWCTKPATGQQPTRDNNLTTTTTSIPMPPQHHPEMIGVITTFDNTPRRKYDEASIWRGGNLESGESPDEALERFSKSYRAALYYQKCCVVVSGGNAAAGTAQSVEASVSQRLMALGRNNGDDGGDDRFVVINSWNEWAEGMAIEPSDVYGYRWLETIKVVQEAVKLQSCAFG